MPGRWSVDRVLALAPDDAAARAGRTLAHAEPWSGAGALDELVWGRCRGSGAAPYQVAVDLAGPAWTCSCPSRKLPCKHALGLLLLWATGQVPDRAEPADFAAAWRAARDQRPARARPRGERDEQAAAARAAQRGARVSAGLAELELWLQDQVRGGLAASGYGHADGVAARMVDAQAPGVAGLLRRLSTVPASGDGWPARLLAGYGQLHLLARAHATLDRLPPALAATVRGHVGYTVTRESVLAEEPLVDDWLVLATRDLLDGAVPARRVWLRGRATGRYALILAFDPPGTFAQHPDAALRPGTSLRAAAHFYPGRPPLRVVLGEHGGPGPAAAPAARLDLAGQLAEWATVLELDPWLAEWPAVLRGVPVRGEAGWRFATEAGAVPLLPGGDPWVLAAVCGGRPAVVAGEWTADGIRALTVWHGERAVPL